MALDKKDIEHIATLARIQLAAQEEDKFAQELGDILGYIEKLEEVDTSSIEPLYQVSGISNRTRDDKPGEFFNGANLVRQAPQSEKGFVKVRAILKK